MNDPAANPFAAPQHGADRADEPMAGGPVVYLGFWRRVLASIVDNIIFTVVLLPILWLIFGSWSSQHFFDAHANVTNLLTAVIVLVFWHRFQATPGKMIWKARILDERTLQPPTLGKLLLRYVGYIPSLVVLGLGFLWVAFDQKKRGWHDLMAGTVVVRQAA